MGTTFFGRLFAPENRSHWFWGIALLALLIEVCFHALLPVSISNDSYGYIALSHSLLNPNVAFERSVGYPLFLALTGLNLFDSLIPVMLAQAAMAVAIPLVVFSCLERFGLKYAVLGALIACLYFYNFAVSLSVLTELAYVFAIALYGYFLVQYFFTLTTRHLMYVIAACWLIALIRLSGSQYFLSLLAGIGCYIAMQLMLKNREKASHGVRQFIIAAMVYMAIAIPYGLITNRTSSVVWPHFVFHWAYKDDAVAPIFLGVIDPENGPATQKLFKEIERIVTENPAAFDTLKTGGTDEVKALKPGSDKKYGPKAVKLLMEDLARNHTYDFRAWQIEGVLMGSDVGTVGTMKLLRNAIIEAFIKHPDKLIDRMVIVVRERIGTFLFQGIDANIVSLPTAYHHQVPKVGNDEPVQSLRSGIYRQWTYDMYNHTGTAAADRDVFHPGRYPTTLAGALEHVKTDNLIGFGHYVTIAGMQILRLCWALIAVGLVIFPFTKKAPLLASLLCASIVPPVLAVFLSETDPRHLLMCSPIHFVTAVVVFYVIVDGFRRRAHG